MVVSKDNKRRRKEPTPPPAQSTVIESSPELPKRPKVHAQRKFAQNQYVPPSAYNTLPSSSGTPGPSTSTEVQQEPIDVLPNVRPTTQDFLTFLCFRHNSELPAHLRHLRQGPAPQESDANESASKTDAVKTSKPVNSDSAAKVPGKRGRPRNAQKNDKGVSPGEDQTPASTTPAPKNRLKDISSADVQDKNAEPSKTLKRNLPAGKSNTEKCSNNGASGKRRANRASGKPRNEDESEDERLSARTSRQNEDDANESKLKLRNSSETPSKESETTKSTRRGRPPNKKTIAELKMLQSISDAERAKDKQPPKRARTMRESPIFIPSPEPSGRMTRQRAFFEPVKVSTSAAADDNTNSSESKNLHVPEVAKTQTEETPKVQPPDDHTEKAGPKRTSSDTRGTLANGNTGTSKQKFNVFDFSSDDEQPLAKAVKSKRYKPSADANKKLTSARGRKPASTRGQQRSADMDVDVSVTPNSPGLVQNIPSLIAPMEADDGEERELEKDEDLKQLDDDEQDEPIKKLLISEKNEDSIQDPHTVGKNTPLRRTASGVRCNPNNSTNAQVETGSPARSQRPTRKTKEAATIYMGIIGHKLQLADDEDDDLSLSSFPDIPNVKEMEKIEKEIKKNANTNKNTVVKLSAQPNDKPPPAPRRGRPPKHPKPASSTPAPPKPDVANVPVKKRQLSEAILAKPGSPTNKAKADGSKAYSDNEDFLLNEELMETKRKLEKSFSDSDDEPLAVKANVKVSSEKDFGVAEPSKAKPDESNLSLLNPKVVLTPALTMLPLVTKTQTISPFTHSLPLLSTAGALSLQNTTATSSNSATPLNAQLGGSCSGGSKKTSEKKSPLPVSKILSVPAAYGMPGTSATTMQSLVGSSFGKSPTSFMSYHTQYARPPPTPAHPFSSSTVKSPTLPNLQSPLKYHTPPTTYPPPIEAYQCPKINPNFLTPKFDRSSLSRSNNFPSPIRFDTPRNSFGAISNLSVPNPPIIHNLKITPPAHTVALTNVLASSLPTTSVAIPTTPLTLATTIVATTASASHTTTTNTAACTNTNNNASNGSNCNASQSAQKDNAASDALKDEIGAILAANLMPSKEESGKIFGIASVSLAQSSGPDNTKCTLGKCGSIHKPVLGPVVPTEGYLIDQLSSKERRKAKVNMTHEQIQKWLIECSSNPDDIQDDLDDDFEDSLRQQQTITPPPTRDDKESTTFSSSSKNTRELGKSESAWSAKGPSLKATPVVATSNRRDEDDNNLDSNEFEFEKVSPTNLAQKSTGLMLTGVETQKSQQQITKDQPLERKAKDSTQSITKDKQKLSSSNAPKSQKSKIFEDKISSTTQSCSRERDSPCNSKAVKNDLPKKGEQMKRAPVYSPQAAKPETKLISSPKLKHSANSARSGTAHNDSSLFGAFKVDNEKSIYSFDKDDEMPPTKELPTSSYRQRYSEEASGSTAKIASVISAIQERLPTKKRAAAEAAATAVALTLSPAENCKIEKTGSSAKNTRASKKGESVALPAPVKEVPITSDADQDSNGARTFYIPLQGAGIMGTGDSGIQGVAIKLGRVMEATLVTKAQMDTNAKPIRDSENANVLLMKSLLSAANAESSTATNIKPGTSDTSSLLTAPIATPQPLGSNKTTDQPGCSNTLVRVNSSSSLFSGSAKSRTAAPVSQAKKYKDDTPIKMANNTAFPRHDDPTQMVEAPIFRPTEKEFADPIEFIERITPLAARFGICKIVPPASFKPECRISDEMRFTAYNQYVHKMLHRWGPSAKELSAIKKYLATQSIVMNHPPWIGGMEVDLPRLYHTVQELGGLKEVIEKKKWSRVAEEMCIPKLAQDRVTKLDDIYCKYLLPYDTLSPVERQKLFDEVEADWAKHEARARRNADRSVNAENMNNEDDLSTEDEESDDEIDGVSMECIVKGRSMPLSQFYRIARNTMALWFKNADPTVGEVEAEFWRHVAVRDSHVCVHSGSIDSSGWGYGFPAPGPKGKGSAYARHPWNLKVLTNNAGSVLRSLGPVMGVTVPTLHVGMLFSACCWYRDPHGLSWVEYLHTGASKLWYGIPDDQSNNFRAALTSLIPTHCQNKTIWLPCDTVMVPPHMLCDRGVSLCRVEQKPGEYIVVFPRAYTSSISTGYVVSESVYFATNSWLDWAKDDFRDIHESCEPAMFSLEQLLFAIGKDQRVNTDTLQQVLPMLKDVVEKEMSAREELKDAGVVLVENASYEKGGKSKKQQQQQLMGSMESECDQCRANLFISMMRTDDGNVYCLLHALHNIKNGNLKPGSCKLIHSYNSSSIQQLIKALQDKLQQKRNVGGIGAKKAK